jgi:uncharacterized protein (DUF849 family)
MTFDKLIINVALTGVVPTKEQNPYVPISPKEIADDAIKVYNLGASIVHIHARDESGLPSHKKEIFAEIIDRIRQKSSDLIITVSLSGRRVKELSYRIEVLELDGNLKPDLASLTLGSMNFINGSSENSPEVILALLNAMQLACIKPELEIFDAGMANYARYLFKKGFIAGNHYANLILGSLGTMAADPKNLIHLLGELPEKIIWAATGVGQFAFDMQALSIAIGGHVRVGLEDSLYMDKAKHELATNETLVLRVRKASEAVGREIASPKEVRGILNLDDKLHNARLSEY